MGVPVLYQGSKYAPVPFVPIPPDVTPPAGDPQFVSAEIGTVNASTLVVTFDQDVTANENDYALGVTIKVNGTATSMTGGIRQVNHAVIYYDIPVLWHGAGDAVTWEYNTAAGIIVAESGGAALGDVSAQAVTNNCEYAALMDLQADTLALSDGDPVALWADQSGQGHDFTQTGDARPTFHTDANGGYLTFDGVDDTMLGQNFADNLLSLTAFFVINAPGSSANVIGKWDDGFLDGFECGVDSLYWAHNGNDNVNVYYNLSDIVAAEHSWSIHTLEKLSNSTGHYFLNGGNNDLLGTNGDPIVSFSNSNPIRICYYSEAYLLRAIMLFSPIPSAANRTALETRIGARYGITVP